ncbi:unnamed protein product, partial [Didymodactylos carnosus]
LQLNRLKIANESDNKWYEIQGGSGLLAQAMVADCQTIESNRCSIQYSASISQVQLLSSNQIQLTTNNNVSQTFDTIVVKTTATLAQMIDFEPRIHFAQKYSAMRQVYYICGKIKHWCVDPYERGAFATPIPSPPEIIELQSPISNMHFIGEHTSLVRGMIEGALSSAIRGAIAITENANTTFDAIIVGGGFNANQSTVEGDFRSIK